MKAKNGKSDSSIQTAISSECNITGQSYQVSLNVYGLTELNDKLRKYKVGIFHVGVQVHDHEWSFGCHRYPISGIFGLHKPRDLLSLTKNDKMFYLLQPIIVGTTPFSLNQITSYLNQMGRNDWTGLKYHIIYKNSATFALKLCLFLCNKEIPQWINCIAFINNHEPQILNEVPEDFRTPFALKEIVQSKINFALSHQKRWKLKAMAKQNQKTEIVKQSDAATSSSVPSTDPANESGATNKVADPLNEKDSLDAILDSKIFAATSLEDFQKEIEAEIGEDI